MTMDNCVDKKSQHDCLALVQDEQLIQQVHTYLDDPNCFIVARCG